jgi:formylglycine-generating enzyme required for sulfatase activity
MTKHQYVTIKEYREFDTSFKSLDFPLGFPVTNVTYKQAKAFCDANRGRLPTTKELESEFCPLWEWTSTTKDSEKTCMLHGGAWDLNIHQVYVRASFRDRLDLGGRGIIIGFRCIKDTSRTIF